VTTRTAAKTFAFYSGGAGDTAERELSIDELDTAAGGCPGWLGAVAGGIVLRAITAGCSSRPAAARVGGFSLTRRYTIRSCSA
jgi:hypothetical protein